MGVAFRAFTKHDVLFGMCDPGFWAKSFFVRRRRKECQGVFAAHFCFVQALHRHCPNRVPDVINAVAPHFSQAFPSEKYLFKAGKTPSLLQHGASVCDEQFSGSLLVELKQAREKMRIFSLPSNTQQQFPSLVELYHELGAVSLKAAGLQWCFHLVLVSGGKHQSVE